MLIFKLYIYRLFIPMPGEESPEDKALRDLKSLWSQVSQACAVVKLYMQESQDSLVTPVCLSCVTEIYGVLYRYSVVAMMSHLLLISKGTAILVHSVESSILILSKYALWTPSKDTWTN